MSKIPRIKIEFETRNYYPNSIEVGGIISRSLEEADEHCKFHNQCTWNEAETNSNGYSVIYEYRNDELHNELYFI